jgi:predicted metal-dependent phosphoesterase TrpH
VLKVDLHLHTADDPQDRICYSARALIDRAAILGFDALAITLHDRQCDDERLTAYASERGILLIPGIERTIRGRHVLLLNYAADAVAGVRSLDELAALKASGDGLVIAPHPFFPDRTCLGAALDAYADVFDAVEWSYFWTSGVNFNARAGRWARRHGKPIVGNSDLHDLRQLGRTCSLVDAPRDAAAICEAIRAGRSELVTAPVPPLELLSVFGGMLLRPRRHPDDDVESATPAEAAGIVRPRRRTPRGTGSDLDFRIENRDPTPPSSGGVVPTL